MNKDKFYAKLYKKPYKKTSRIKSYPRIITNLFDMIYVINLDNRTDRLQHVINQFQKVNLKFERFSAICPKIRNLVRRGQLGCLLSHLELLKTAQKNRFERILVCEDDVIFHPKFRSIITPLMKQIDTTKWDLLYLGAHSIVAPKQVKPNLIKINGAASTHCYSTNLSSYSKIIKIISSNLNTPLDIIYRNSNLVKYMSSPMLAWQTDGFSDIFQKYRNHGIPWDG